MIITKNSNTTNYKPCPEYEGAAVCVDVTPLKEEPIPPEYAKTRKDGKTMQSVFRLVFEVNETREDGSRYCVWSAKFTPSFHEKSKLRKFLKEWFGRDLTEPEMAKFDMETLIGRPAKIIVVNEPSKDGTKVWANIKLCMPWKGDGALTPSGKYTREINRKSGDASYQRTNKDETDERSAHARVTVHVGKYSGMQMGDLPADAITKLAESWLPTVRGNAKSTADDKRLIGAIEFYIKQFNMAKEAPAPAQDDIDY